MMWWTSRDGPRRTGDSARQTPILDAHSPSRAPFRGPIESPCSLPCSVSTYAFGCCRSCMAAGDYAVEVRRTMLEGGFDCLTVPLPRTSADVETAVERLPAVSVVVQRESREWSPERDAEETETNAKGTTAARTSCPSTPVIRSSRRSVSPSRNDCRGPISTAHQRLPRSQCGFAGPVRSQACAARTLRDRACCPRSRPPVGVARLPRTGGLAATGCANWHARRRRSILALCSYSDWPAIRSAWLDDGDRENSPRYTTVPPNGGCPLRRTRGGRAGGNGVVRRRPAHAVVPPGRTSVRPPRCTSARGAIWTGTRTCRSTASRNCSRRPACATSWPQGARSQDHSAFDDGVPEVRAEPIAPRTTLHPDLYTLAVGRAANLRGPVRHRPDRNRTRIQRVRGRTFRPAPRSHPRHEFSASVGGSCPTGPS